ncbi:hypothetical protein, partial [Intestinimonas butyriciproducens]|uniref:hypothetical protein n=1 Tax=Intestinimonas butyriciproducens TaxID=1297617 RepID=UPI001957A30B
MAAERRGGITLSETGQKRARLNRAVPFSLSKKSSESWAFSFARGKIAIGGEKDAGTWEDGSQ